MSAAKPFISPAFLLLAGGQSRRMGGGDKNLMMLGGQSVLAHVLARVRAQIDDDAPMLLNANGDPSRYADFGLPVEADVVAGHAGPLAGILTGLEWLQAHHPDRTHMMSLATDAPFLPPDLVARLMVPINDPARNDSKIVQPTIVQPTIVQASSNGRRHPVFAIWPVSIAASLRHALVADGTRKIDDFTADYDCAVVPFEGDPDPFMNLNRPDDFTAAATYLQKTVSGP